MLQPRKTRNDTRTLLLDAAHATSQECGPSHISLEAVALRAGVSKGGLLYHFPSKSALLRALVQRYVDDLRDEIETAAPGCFEPGGPALQGACAFVRAMRDRACPTQPSLAGVLAAMMEDPDFMSPAIRLNRDLHALFCRCPAPDRAEILFLALQGVTHGTMMYPGNMSPDERQQILNRCEGELRRMDTEAA